MASNYKYFIEAADKLYPLIIDELGKSKSKTYMDDLTFKELDDWRINEFPQHLSEVYAKEGRTYLTKAELTKLMEWKLTKGKFRPTLKGLIAKNDAEEVEQTTREGYDILLRYIEGANSKAKMLNETAYFAVIKESMKKLCELKGVGPATASLLLSLLNKTSILSNESSFFFAPPFFSDESFMYLIRKENIKYNVKEYITELLPVYLKINKYLQVDLNVIERGAWSLKMMDLNLFNINVPFEIEADKLQGFIDNNGDNNDDDGGFDEKVREDVLSKKRTHTITDPKSRKKRR